jgi:hypothetical protein
VIRSIVTAVTAILALQAAPPRGAPAQPELPKLVVLYEEALDARGLTELAKLGAQRYFVVYQNNADPNAQKTGVIDPSEVARYVIKSQGDTPEGWGVLDFEDPFDDLLQKDPTSERSKAAIKSMVETIRVMKRAFPRVRWTYYGMPGLKYYLPDGDWSKASARSKTAEVDRQIAAYGPVLSECDWLSPCVYYTVGDARHAKVAPPSIRDATRAWVTERTAMCVRFATTLGRPVPVIPFASPLYMPGGGARAFGVIPGNVLDEDILAPMAQGGAAGVCIWTGATNFIGIATGARPGESMTEGGGKAGLVKTWSEDLGVTAAELEGEGGRERLTGMISRAQVSMANAARGRWSSPDGKPATKPAQ